MIGAIAGDIIGSIYEGRPCKQENFPLFTSTSTFTDDTVTTIAITKALLYRKRHFSHKHISGQEKKKIYREQLKNMCRKYPYAGYGTNFRKWVFESGNRPYGSYGNGSAMRVSAIGFCFSNLKQVLHEAKLCAEITHNHPEGIKGARAIAAAVFLANRNKSKASIKKYIESEFNYNVSYSIDFLRENYKFDISCQGSVPQAISVFLKAENFEDTVRKAVLIGGDSDTIACMAGGIAQAFYKKIPGFIIKEVKYYLDFNLKNILSEAEKVFKINYKVC